MPDETARRPRAAARLHVTGVVQGVGFRPFVHRLATRLGVAGSVRNAFGDVEIVVEGEPAMVDAMAEALRREAPPLARVDEVVVEPLEIGGRTGFSIVTSAASAGAEPPVTLVPPDVAMCDACGRELRDPADRRFGYAFITCTDCGPRYSVIASLPYDRERTSIAAFVQCPACLAEYERPGDRRHHSETNGCPVCGPQLAFVAADADEPAWHVAQPPAAAIASAAALLRAGGVLALRGVGGFHLAVDARDAAAVALLRARKHRDAKPLAVMVRTLAEAGTVARVSPAAARWLGHAERPIVILPRRAGAPLADGVAPGLDTVGLLLAYTPLHHLLLDAVDGPLVMTSGNLSDEPLAAGIDEARARLGGIADGFLVHDREILARIDDSVMRIVDGEPVLVRRARGFAPLPVPLPVGPPVPLLAVGAQMKGTFTLATGRRAFASPHLGDLDSLETVRHFRETLGAYERLFRTAPRAIACDLHPGYLSTRLAHDLAAERGLPAPIAVQHHHAHVAAVLAEHGETGPALGIAFDGTGYGTDGTVWGGEFLVATLGSFQRVARVRPAPLPGGDAAVRAPWRTALGYCALAPDLMRAVRAAVTAGRREADVAIVERQVARALNTPLHSSMGRLFDAAAAVLGLHAEVAYEGQAAMALEAVAAQGRGRALPFPVIGTPEDGWQLDPVPLLESLAQRRAGGEDVGRLAAAFHDAIVRATARLAVWLAEDASLTTVALAGGCFQNARLLAGLHRQLAEHGLRVLVPRTLPPNDGAISYGQAAVAAARLRAAADAGHPLDERREPRGVTCA